MDLAHAQIQYDRLERHYRGALENRDDQVSLLDLAHSLRVWVDMKDAVTKLAAEKAIELRFQHYSDRKKVKKTLRGKKTISLPVASGVERESGAVRGVRIIQGDVTPEEIKTRFEAGVPQQTPSKMNFPEWLGAAVYDVPSEDEKHPKLSVSREILIKRVANMLGASHPAGMDKGESSENRFDPIVRTMHETMKIDGYPATYYQLLEIGKDILEAFKELRECAT